MSNIFSIKKLIDHRNRAINFFPQYDYLFEHVSNNIIDRLSLLPNSFTNIIEINSRSCTLTNKIENFFPESRITICDISQKILNLVSDKYTKHRIEQELILLEPGKYDLILSSLYIHWINNLPLFLQNIDSLLSEKAVVIFAFIGGNSLANLRNFFIENELKLQKSITPHISPFIKQETILNLCKNLKMQNIIIDTEIIEIEYQDCYSLMKELSLMGESSCLIIQENYSIHKNLLKEAKNSGKFIERFEIIYLSYWK
jgi:NADH dehydrogenase [ubiquinone] 1 alpha subcomplex assembly factor 5